MQKAKLDVLVAQLAYGGNGGVATVLPSLVTWFSKINLEMHQDERIGRIAHKTYGDVPLSMERNRIVKDAIDGGFDVILMLDSDNVPDLYVGQRPNAKPFWGTSFDFLYDRKVRGLPTVVCAPYCGPPPHPTRGGEENVYVFYAEEVEGKLDGSPQSAMRFAPYTRQHAAQMSGIQPIAAGPTGVIMYSTCAFELIPRRVDPLEVLAQYGNGEIDASRAVQLLARESWFYYEYTDADQSQKASTEDVTFTRNCQLAGILKHGESVVFCNWDSWAGHYKPKCVGAPEPLPIEAVSQVFREAVRNNISATDRRVELDLPDLPYDGPMLEMREDEPNSKPATAESLTWTVERNGNEFTHLGFLSDQRDLKHLRKLVSELPSEPGMRNVAVEVGSWVGDSAVAMIEADENLMLTCVDTFGGTPSDPLGAIADAVVKHFDDTGIILKTFKENTRPYRQRIAYKVGTSQERVGEFADGSLDFVYLDAGHTYDELRADIDLWYPKVKPGGTIAGHDFGDPQFPGVMEAVLYNFAGEYSSAGKIWWHVKPAKEATPKEVGEMILGKVFNDPLHDPEDAHVLNNCLMYSPGNTRAILFGDRTGELSWATVKGMPDMTAYSVNVFGLDPIKIHSDADSGRVRDIASTEWQRISKDPQGVDYVIVGCNANNPGTEYINIARKHLAKDGTLILIGDQFGPMTREEVADLLGVRRVSFEMGQMDGKYFGIGPQVGKLVVINRDWLFPQPELKAEPDGQPAV